MFSFPTGPNIKSLKKCDTIGKIFDVVWSDISLHILEETKKRENVNWNVDHINLFLASQLVMGLSPQPSIEDYFKDDPSGIFGSNWMKKRFTASWWSNIHNSIHYDLQTCIGLLRNNSQKVWNLDQVLVVDEMLILLLEDGNTFNTSKGNLTILD